MALSETARTLLRSCAESMAQGEERDVDLFETLRYSGSREMRWEIWGELKSFVEGISSRERSVTPGDPTLFKGELVRPGFYFIVHNFSDMTITGIIKELKDDAALYILRPHENGLLMQERAEHN